MRSLIDFYSNLVHPIPGAAVSALNVTNGLIVKFDGNDDEVADEDSSRRKNV